MPSKKPEHVIRDHLKNNLDFIEPNLVLIDEKEFRLPNIHGAEGFIDILAKDQDGNYVVIEIKRSDSSARETLTELAKYVALLRQNFGLRLSEIRIIVLSSEWHELLVPYSEFYHATSYNIEAYNIGLNDDHLPISKERVEPLERYIERSVSPYHVIWLYTNSERREISIRILREKLQNLRTNDYLIIKVENVGQEQIIYPYGIYFVPQLYRNDSWLQILHETNSREEIEEISQDYSPEELTPVLLDYFFAALEMDADAVEVGYPEKFVSITSSRGWSISEIIRAGIYQADTRLSDDQILQEIRGYYGASFTWYFRHANSSNRALIEEITGGYSNCLVCNEDWRNIIENILQYLARKENAYSLTVSIFNTDDIIESLTMIRFTGKFYSYVPGFTIIVDFDNQEIPTEIFQGVINWDGTTADLDSILERQFQGESSIYFISRHVHEIHSINGEIMRVLGLSYSWVHFNIVGKQVELNESPRLQGSQIISEERSNRIMVDFFLESEEFLDRCVEFYGEHTNLLHPPR